MPQIELIPNTYNSEEGRIPINNAFSGQATFNLVQTKIFSSPPLTLSDAATISWDYSLGHNAKVTLTDDRLLLVSNATSGSCGKLMVFQDGTGNRKLTLTGGIPKVVSGGTGNIILSTGATAVDILTFFYDGLIFYWDIENNFT